MVKVDTEEIRIPTEMMIPPSAVKSRDGKKPGPRPTACPWCSLTNCSHCRCSGTGLCDHDPSGMCSRERYKRRLVCNPCEKHKLRARLATNGGESSSSRPRGMSSSSLSSEFAGSPVPSLCLSGSLNMMTAAGDQKVFEHLSLVYSAEKENKFEGNVATSRKRSKSMGSVNVFNHATNSLADGISALLGCASALEEGPGAPTYDLSYVETKEGRIRLQSFDALLSCATLEDREQRIEA